MRVCLMIEGQEGVTWDQWRALAETAEASGFEALFRSDHYMPLAGGPGGSLDAWATLNALAAITTSLSARDARLARHVPPPVHPRPRGRDSRPRLGRARRARPRRRLARGRARRVRVPVRHRQDPLRPPGRADGDRPPLVDRGTVRLPRPPLPAPPSRPTAQAGPQAQPDRRRQRQARVAPRSPLAGRTSTTRSTRRWSSAASGASAWRPHARRRVATRSASP